MLTARLHWRVKSELVKDDTKQKLRRLQDCGNSSTWPQGASAGKHEKRLLQYLFENRTNQHNPIERPVENDTDILYVWFKVSLQQIIDVDEKNQILFSSIWLDLTWTDYHFKWDPKHFGNITKINIDPKRVWRPDVLLYNSADEKFDGTYPTNVVIDRYGFMTYIPPGMFKSTCKIDITWFPFDTQECLLKFGSWTYDGGTVDLRFKCSNESLDTIEKRLNDPSNCTESGSGDTSNYVISGEWNLEGMPGQRTALLYDCCQFPFIDLKYIIKIRRRTLYYGFNLIIPCVLISTMTLLTFLLPPDAGEKISLGVTILLSLIMFLLLVADAMPQTSESLPLIGVTILLSLTVFLKMVGEAMPATSDSVPVIGMYFACTMIMCSLSVVFTVIVLNYHHRNAESHPIPNWVRKFICVYLASVLCMRHHGRIEHMEPIRIRRRVKSSNSGGFRSSVSLRDLNSPGQELRDRCSKSLLANVLDLEDDIRIALSTAQQQQQRLQQHRHPHQLSSAASVVSGATSPLSYRINVTGAPDNGHRCSTRIELEAIVQELRIVKQKIANDVADSETSSEWKFAARVIDRLCLILFSGFTVIATCAILFSAPDVFKG